MLMTAGSLLVSKCLLTDGLLIASQEKRKSNYILEKLVNILTVHSKLSSTIGLRWILCTWEGHSISQVVGQLKMWKLHLIMRKASHKQKMRYVLLQKKWNCTVQKCQYCKKTRAMEMFQGKRLNRHGNKCDIWFWISSWRGGVGGML